MPSGSSTAAEPGRRWRGGPTRAVVALFVGILAVFSLAPPTGAAGASAPEDGADEGSGSSIGGVLRTRDEAGEDVFVEGVTMIVSVAADSGLDNAGDEIGQAVSDAEGVWRVPIPDDLFIDDGSGGIPTARVDVTLVEETLPDGVPLRQEGRNQLTGIEVDLNEAANTLFPLGEAVESTDNTIRSLQLFVDGVKLGLIIAMCAVGLSLIYGTTGLTNFAHGEAVTFGAMVAFVFHVVYPGRILGIPGTNSLIFAAILALIICGIAGWAFNEFVWRRLRKRGASLIAALVVSIGFSILLRNVYLYQFGERSRFYRDFQIQERIDFGWFELAPKDVFIIVFSVVVLVGIGLALQKTRAGKAMRAVADNRDLAASSGIDVEAVIKWVWIAGTALAGLGGILLALTEDVNFLMGFRLLLLMFAGVTLGGLGTAYGALFGSLIVGVFIQMITLIIPNDMKNIGALAVLIIILLVRPQGLLGRKERIG